MHATKDVFVLCFGGLGPGGCAVAFEPMIHTVTCKDRYSVDLLPVSPLFDSEE